MPWFNDPSFYGRLARLVKENNREGLRVTLNNEMITTGFCRSEYTEWAYRRIASFLEDGWTACETYWEFNDRHFISPEEVGRIVNMLVGGMRPDPAHPNYVFANQAGHVAAYFVSLVTKPSRVFA